MTMSYLAWQDGCSQRAIELDPSYARAYTGIADYDSALHIWYAARLPINGDILAMSAKALALDPNLAEAHAARAMALHHDGQDAEALGYFKRLALDPDLFEANFYFARSLFRRGAFEQATRLFRARGLTLRKRLHSPIHR